jgi:hypothetical protein
MSKLFQYFGFARSSYPKANVSQAVGKDTPNKSYRVTAGGIEDISSKPGSDGTT